MIEKAQEMDKLQRAGDPNRRTVQAASGRVVGGGAFAERQDGERNVTPFFQNLADAAEPDPAAVVKNYFSAAGSSGVDIRV